MLYDNPDLRNLIELEKWQKIQDLFADAFEITLQTISPDGAKLSEVSRPNRLCNEILPKSPKGEEFCGVCVLKKSLKEGVDVKEIVNFKCPVGCDLYVIPIKAVGQRIDAYIIAGPLILISRKNVEEYARSAKRLDIPAETLTDALIDLNVFSYNKIYTLTQLLGSIFSNMVQSGYHKKRLGEITPEIVKMDPLFSKYYEEKVLNSLLNACALALEADSGSVMTVDEKTNMLHMKVSTKLDEDIANKANMKMGEGIAGLAAATHQPIILPKDQNKSGLSGKLKRKYIKSSIIVPFEQVKKKKAHSTYGVINLNVVRKDKDFSERDIALVKELINLASIAMVPLQPADSPKKKT